MWPQHPGEALGFRKLFHTACWHPPAKPRQAQLGHGGTGKKQELEVYTKMQEEAPKHLHYRDKMDMALSLPQPQQQEVWGSGKLKHSSQTGVHVSKPWLRQGHPWLGDTNFYLQSSSDRYLCQLRDIGCTNRVFFLF